jgi:NDP-sugar pyrophosphorylase family protein
MANYSDPESCVAYREVWIEAMTGDTGRPAIEPRNHSIGVPMVLLFQKVTRIWHWVHVSPQAQIGERCSLGQNVYVGNDVVIGNNVKIQNNVSVYDAVTIEDDVFCGPSMVKSLTCP